jgi:hypothetical protein
VSEVLSHPVIMGLAKVSTADSGFSVPTHPAVTQNTQTAANRVNTIFNRLPDIEPYRIENKVN